MEPEGEPLMAKEGAVLALVVLLTFKGGKLATICLEGLFNLTCVNNSFAGMLNR